MRALENILGEMIAMLEQGRESILAKLALYRKWQLPLPPKAPNERYRLRHVEHITLQNAVNEDLLELEANLDFIKTMQGTLLNARKVGHRPRFRCMSKAVRKLCSAGGFLCSTDDGIIQHCTDRVSDFFHTELEQLEATLHRLERKLMRHYWNSQATYVETSLGQGDIGFERLLAGVTDNHHVKTIIASVYLLNYNALLDDEFANMVNSAKQLFAFEITGGFFSRQGGKDIFAKTLSEKLRPVRRCFFIKISDAKRHKNHWHEVYIARHDPNEAIQWHVATASSRDRIEIDWQGNAFKRLQDLSAVSDADLTEYGHRSHPMPLLAIQHNDFMALRYLINRQIPHHTITLNDGINTRNWLHTAVLHGDPIMLHYLSNLMTITENTNAANGRMCYMLDQDVAPQHLRPMAAVLRYRQDHQVLAIIQALRSHFEAPIDEDLVQIAYEADLPDVVIYLLEEGGHINATACIAFQTLLTSQQPSRLKTFLEQRHAPFEQIDLAVNQTDFARPAALIAMVGFAHNIPDAIIQQSVPGITDAHITRSFIQWEQDHRLFDINAYRTLSNDTLLYFAYQRGAAGIYGYLVAIGATATDEEQNKMGPLPKGFVASVTHYLPSNMPDLALFLASRTHIRSLPDQPPIDRVAIYNDILNPHEPCDQYHEHLIPVLRVLQHFKPAFSIYIDTVQGNISGLVDSSARGSFFREPPYRVYVSHQGDWHRMKGTLIHELTHFVCKVVYNNQCLPFEEENANNRIACYAFRSDMSQRKSDFEGDYLTYFNKNRLWRAYPEDQLDAQNNNVGIATQIKELIVRVPQTLFVYGQQGLKALEQHMQRQTERDRPRLLDYYRDIFIPDCQAFVASCQLETRLLSPPHSPGRGGGGAAQEAIETKVDTHPVSID